MKKISVVGSINTDFVFSSKNLPKPNETIMGTDFAIFYGGKGANVAVATSKLGAKTTLFGAIGDDIFSKDNLKNLKANKVNVKNVQVMKNVTGGVAGINVGSNTNSITVVPGSNGKYGKQQIKSNLEKILSADVVITQLETNFEGVEYLIDECYKHGKILIFNPSPIIELKEDLLKKCGYIIVNEIEIKMLPHYESDEQILTEYDGKLILTTGGGGVYYYNNGIKHEKCIKVKPINTTGAGDTFLGAFALSIAEGNNITKSIKFANICAGLKVTKEGTQNGMPTKDEYENFVNQLNN